VVKVSIIVPIYNGIRYLPDFIKAIDNIDFDDCEIIFAVDQRSSDGSVEAVFKIIDANPQMRVVVQTEKTGSGGARNLGLDIAVGKYIGFFDVDDIPLPNYIHDLVGILDDTNSDVVFCNYSEEQIINCGPESKLTLLTPGKAILSVTAGDMPGMPWGSMWRSDVIGNKRFIIGSTAEDTDFIIRCLTNTEKIAFYDCPLYIYNTRDMSGDPRQNCLARAEKYYDLIDYLEETMPEIANEYSEKALMVQLRWGAKRGGKEFVDMMNSDLLQKWKDRCKNPIYEFRIAQNLPKIYCALGKIVADINSRLGLRMGKVG
jgi:glycosyltransferase involved in cell wall biosynthesis